MNCIKHPDVPSKATCRGCAEPFCANCLVNIKGDQYCASCKGMAIGQDAVAAAGAGSAGVCEEANEALKYAIIGIFCCGIILEPIAISKALKARQIISDNPRMEGSGKATAALIIGIVILILNILGIIARIAMAGQRNSGF